MTKDRVMPLGLMIYTLKKVFNRLNPNDEVDNIVFDCIDYPCSFESALHDMEYQYPQYVWFETTLFEIEEREKEAKIQHMNDSGVDKETIDRIRDEMHMQTLKGGWKKGYIAGKETYIKTVEIKLHCNRGRVQALCDPELIGLEAKITIVKPDKSET